MKSISQLIQEWRSLDSQSANGCPDAEQKMREVRFKLSIQGYDPTKLARIKMIPRDEYLESRGR